MLMSQIFCKKIAKKRYFVQKNRDLSAEMFENNKNCTILGADPEAGF
jgi:hypothetical protein